MAVALLMLAFWLARPAFLVPSNQLGILRSMSSIAIMSLGVMTVIVIGEIDLSFGAVYGLASNVVAVAWIVWGVPVWLAIGLALVAAVMVGLSNAVLVTRLRIPSFIVTLGMYNLLYGLTLFISGTNTYSPTYPPPGKLVRPEELAQFAILGSKNAGIPTQVLWLLAIAFIFFVLLHRSLFGFRVYAIGGNSKAARFAGLRVTWYKAAAFVICALTAAVASILDFSFIGSTEPNSGLSFTFPVFAAVIIGGASLVGGRGTVVGTLCGALLLAVLANGLALIAAGSFAQQVFLGAVTIGAVALDRISAPEST